MTKKKPQRSVRKKEEKGFLETSGGTTVNELRVSADPDSLEALKELIDEALFSIVGVASKEIVNCNFVIRRILKEPRTNLKDVKPGDEFELTSPKGVPIQGTAEMVPGIAAASTFNLEGDGKIAAQYDGTWPKMYWDGQVTVTRSGEQIFVDTEGGEWLESQVIPVLKKKD